MFTMKKILFLILTLICLSSCDVDYEIPKNDGSKLVYSNLLTKKTKNDLKSIFKSSGLDHKKTDRFFKQVEFFNSSVNNGLLVKDDYVIADKIKDYDFYAIQDELYKLNPGFTGINCRITTFGLVSDKIEVKNTSNPNMSVVEIDNTSFTNPPVPTLDKEEIEKFNKFYSAIPTENKDNLDYQANKIKDFWNNNGIKFHKNSNYEVISVFEFSNIDENKNELFVGHTGLLFSLEDGRSMLIEKLAFTAPYQVVIFENDNDLYDYLMDLYDYSNDEYPIKPIIFRDDNLFVKK